MFSCFLTTPASVSSKRPLILLSILSVLLAVGSCGGQASLTSLTSGHILAANSTSPPQEDHKFPAENVLKSFLKLSQERSRVLDAGTSSNLTAEEKWVSSVNFISSLTTLAIKASLPLFVSLTYERQDVSAVCSASLLKILSGVRQNQASALSCE